MDTRNTCIRQTRKQMLATQTLKAQHIYFLSNAGFRKLVHLDRPLHFRLDCRSRGSTHLRIHDGMDHVTPFSYDRMHPSPLPGALWPHLGTRDGPKAMCNALQPSTRNLTFYMQPGKQFLCVVHLVQLLLISLIVPHGHINRTSKLPQTLCHHVVSVNTS
jgi:hypothetical protein